MSNKSICSIKLTVAGTKYSYGSHLIYALDPAGKFVRIRHRRQLPVSRHSPATVFVLSKQSSPLSSMDLAALAAEYELARAFHDNSEHALVAALSRFDNFRITYEHLHLSPLALLAIGTTTDAEPRILPSTRIATGEGGWGYTRTPLDELTVLARNNRASSSFYENAASRARRQRDLVFQLTKTDPAAITALVTDLRNNQRLRTPSIAVAVDAAVAGHPQARFLLELVMQRPDEPGLVLRYYIDNYAESSDSAPAIPQSIRKAVASVATSLYTEAAVLAYDRARTKSVDGATEDSNMVRFADVIRLTHPKPKSAYQDILFGYLTSSSTTPPEPLLRLSAAHQLRQMGRAARTTELAWAVEAVSTIGEYTPRAPRVHRLDVLPWRDIVAWAPPTDQYLQAASALATATAKRRSSARELKAASFKERDLKSNLRKLEIHHRRDEKILQRTPSTTDPITEQRYVSRASRIHQLQTELNQAQQRVFDLGADTNFDIAVELDAKATIAATPRVDMASVFDVAIPYMGYKDTLSSLAAFDRAGISESSRAWAKAHLADPEAAKNSSLLPDVISAAKVTGGWVHRDFWGDTESEPALESNWDDALETALEVSTADLVPTINGKVLVMVDGSGSMLDLVTPRQNDRRAQAYESLQRDEVASLFAALIANKATSADVYTYDTSPKKVDLTSTPTKLAATRALIASMEGGGTDTWGSVMQTWDDHDVVVVLTDEQTSWTPDQPSSSSGYGYRRPLSRTQLPAHVQVITLNLAGDEPSHAPEARHTVISGVTEQLFVELASAVEQAELAKSSV